MGETIEFVQGSKIEFFVLGEIECLKLQRRGARKRLVSF